MDTLMDVTLPDGYRMARMQPEDILQLVDLINVVVLEYAPETEKLMTAEEMSRQLATPGLHMEEDAFNIFYGDQLVAGGAVFSFSPHVSNILQFVIHPDYRFQEIVEPLYDVCMHRAKAFIPLAEPDLRVVLTSTLDGRDAWRRHFFESHGFAISRAFWEMCIDMTEPPEVPNFGGLQLRPFDPDKDLRAVYDAIGEAFKDHYGYIEDEDPDEDFERWRYGMTDPERFDPALWFVLMEGDEIAAAALCQSYARRYPDAGYVSAVGVLPRWRRRGLGKALLLHSFNEFWKRGKRSVRLMVDAENITGATRLYENVGMYRASEGLEYEQELRAGIDPIRR